MSGGQHSSAVAREAPQSEGIELVFGFVAPTGVDLGRVLESLKSQLKDVGYKTEVIRLSELITPYLYGSNVVFPSEYDRIRDLMEYGTTLREATQTKDIVARLGVAKLRAKRRSITGSDDKPAARTAYIVSSFKRPEEVELFRQIYGKAFTLISVYSPKQSRINDLAKKLRSSIPIRREANERASQLIERDYEEEGRKLGQRVGKTFPLADYFLTLESKAAIDRDLSRLVRLTFGHPYISPTRVEQGMFFAQAAAFRSLDLSRQVGAAVVDQDGSVLATGCNEVPKFGGGLYWGEDEHVARDYELGHDANVAAKAELWEDAVDRIKRENWLKPSLKRRATKDLVESSLLRSDGFMNNSLRLR